MKNTKWLVGLAAVALLAGCGPTNPETTDKPVDPVEPGVMTTVKLSYNADYKVDVISEKGGMDGFKHDVDDKTVAELDLTKGDLYLYVKRDGKDGSNTSMHEALVHKAGEGYEFVTSTMENPRALKDEAAALAKIDELLHKTSYNLAGYVDLDTLTYSSDYTYEWKEFGLETPNQAAEDFSEPVREENAAGGQKVTVDLDYIGYKTDGGISDFPGRDGKPASKVTLNTNKDGFVTDYTQTLAAGLEMKIMTPAPLVTIDGSKTLSAEYGATLTKKDTIAHELTKGTVTLPNLTQGSLEVFTGKEATEAACTTKVENGAEVIVGEFLGVIVHPAGANTIKNLSNNDITVVDPKKDTMYFFEVQEGANKLGVNFIGDDVVATVKYATFKVNLVEGVTIAETVEYEMIGGQPGPMTPLEGNKVAVGHWVSFKLSSDEAKYAMRQVGADKDLMFISGFWCLNCEEEKEYTVEVYVKDETAPVADAKLVMPTTFAGGMVKATMDVPPAFGKGTNVGNGSDLESGKYLTLKVIPNQGNTIKSVKINGEEITVNHELYAATIVKGNNTVAVEFEGTDIPTKAKFVFKPTEQVTGVTLSTFTMENPKAQTPLEVGADVEIDTWVAIKVNVAEGFQIAKVAVNFYATMEINAGPVTMYCFQATAAGVYNIMVMATPVAA